MTIKNETLVELVGRAGRLVGVKELLRAGGYHLGAQAEVKRALRELVRAGRLTQDGKRFGLPKEKGTPARGPVQVYPPSRGPVPEGPRGKKVARRLHGGEPKRPVRVEGIINHHPDGFAFVSPLVGVRGENVFVPPEEARKALDHDQVVVELVAAKGRTAGRVVEVRSRTRQLVVGVYREERDGAYVEPREAELGQIRVPKTQLARPGDAVKVRLGVGAGLVRSDRLVGEVAGSLGAADDHSVEVLSIAFAKGFHDEFPPEVMDEADRCELRVPLEELRSGHRRDLRALPLVTIDGEDARDFDDAIWVENRPEGWRLVVAIADVSHYVAEGSALDLEALRRATSVYLPGRVLPMLPERLSNGLCSLKPGEDRLCVVADLVIDRKGQPVGADFYPGVMRSSARCTYTEVHEVLAGRDVPGRTELRPLFERAQALASVLTSMRKARGAIEFDLPETKVELGADGLPERLVRRERWESHRLVEECMLAANEAVARFFRERGLPTVNRYHGEPDEERLEAFLTLLGAYGLEAPGSSLTSKELNLLLQRLHGHPEQRSLHQLALRSMMQAVYSVRQAGHYGLGAENYLHFTSPIRRYPDLLVHRLLKEFWGRTVHGTRVDREVGRLEALAAQSSERERAAMQVEREVNALYGCLLMRHQVGDEFAATVSGLSESGFYVTLDKELVDGAVRGETVAAGFHFDQARYQLVFPTGLVVKVGQPVRVRLLSVNLRRRQLEFALVEIAAASPKQGRRRPEPSGRAERATPLPTTPAGSRGRRRPGVGEESKGSSPERTFGRQVLERLRRKAAGKPAQRGKGRKRR